MSTYLIADLREGIFYALRPRGLPHLILDYLFHRTRWADGSRPHEDWHSVPRDGLVQHIIGDLNPQLTTEQIVQLYDIKAAKYRRIRLDQVVSFIYERLENPLPPEQMTRAHLVDYELVETPISVEEYNLVLVKTLKCIEQENLGIVSWERIEKVVPAALITFNPQTDAKDLFNQTFNPSLIRRVATLMRCLRI